MFRCCKNFRLALLGLCHPAIEALQLTNDDKRFSSHKARLQPMQSTQPILLRLLRIIVLLLLLSVTRPTMAQPTPDLRAELVTITAGDSAAQVQISGVQGATFSRAQIAIRNLFTGATAYADADANGAFQVTLLGTAGTPYWLLPAQRISDAQRRANALPDAVDDGVLIWSQTAAASASGFEAGGQVSYGGSVWLARGRVDQTNLQAGDDLTLLLDVTLFAPDADPDLPLTLRGELALQPLFAADGAQIPHPGADWSDRLTRTGLPIATHTQPIPLGSAPATGVRQTEGVIQATLAFSVPLPDDISAGWYVPVFRGSGQIADSAPFGWYANRVFSTSGDTAPDLSSTAPESSTYLPQLLRVGEPQAPQVQLSLLHHNFALAGNAGSLHPVRFQPQHASLAPAAYTITPRLHVPPVLLPALFASGSLTLRQDGTLPTNPLPIQQIHLSRDGRLSLRTLSNRALLDATRYGDKTLFVAATLNTPSGQRVTYEGEHRFIAAESLALLPSVLPGAPFAVGDVPLMAVRVLPSLPAAVSIRLRFAPLFTDQVIERTFSGQADAGGYFQADEIFRFDQPGEYRLDASARYTDAQGRVWAGYSSGAGTVTDPDEAGALARGARGLADYRGAGQIWYDTATYPDDAPQVAPITNYPFFAGDVAYVPDVSNAGVRPVLQFACMDASCPLPDDAYAYLSSTRPAVMLGQAVSAAGVAPRWTNDAALDGQIGAGAAGNRPGDYAWLFGGIVQRNPATDTYTTAGYAALAIITDDDATLRVQPPFIDPVLSIGDASSPLFFHPTGTQPGQTLTRNSRFALAGHIAPPLAGTIDASLTAPSGRTQPISLNANAFGYAYDPAQDVVLNEVGVWRVRVDVSYAGRVSAGDLAAVDGVQRGGIAAQDANSFLVFVTAPDAAPLVSNQPDESEIIPGQPLNFSVDVPPGWTDAQAYYTLRTPAYVLEQGRLRTSNGRAFYQFTPQTLSRSFSNLEFDPRAEGAAAADALTLTFAITGRDANNQRQARTRTFTLLHDRLLSGMLQSEAVN